MSKQHNRITEKLIKMHMAWAVRSDKCLCTDYRCCNVLDGNRPAYHIHPDANYPHVDYIERFTSLHEIESWLAGN